MQCGSCLKERSQVIGVDVVAEVVLDAFGGQQCVCIAPVQRCIAGLKLRPQCVQRLLKAWCWAHLHLNGAGQCLERLQQCWIGGAHPFGWSGDAAFLWFFDRVAPGLREHGQRIIGPADGVSPDLAGVIGDQHEQRLLRRAPGGVEGRRHQGHSHLPLPLGFPIAVGGLWLRVASHCRAADGGHLASVNQAARLPSGTSSA